MTQGGDATPSVQGRVAPEAPAPWSLTGRGYIVLLRLPGDDDDPARWTPAPLRGKTPGGPGLLMYVDYRESGVGPYRELLFIPGRYPDAGGHSWSITRIVVSTEASVRAGRQNWGIPKEVADFDVTPTDDGGERIRVVQGGAMLAELEFGRAGLRLPGGGGLLPASMRRIVQFHEGRCYRFTPSAGGPLAWSRLRCLVTDGDRFPTLGPENVLMSCAAPAFRMQFPVASVMEVQER